MNGREKTQKGQVENGQDPLGAGWGGGLLLELVWGGAGVCIGTSECFEVRKAKVL